jgi:hypothetical protein
LPGRASSHLKVCVVAAETLRGFDSGSSIERALATLRVLLAFGFVAGTFPGSSAQLRETLRDDLRVR